jgi:hypothetical protein
MTHAIGMVDFFVLEAGEYLERLDALAQAPAGTWSAAEEFVRIVRAFRGSALMAGQRPVARAAQGLEAVSRALRDGRLAWDERVRGEVIRAVDDCKTLVRHARTPSEDDARRADTLGSGLERLAGRPSVPIRALGEGLDAAGRAFVARETSAIASALDRAAHALAADPASRDALARIGPAMSALRGVAVLNDLPPLADILVAVDGAVREVLSTSGAVGPQVARLFDAGAKALARAAHEVVDVGRPASDGGEVAAFASLLLDAFVSGGVQPIETLFYDDAGPHVVAAGTTPAALSRVDLVSQGEFLASAASGLERAASPVLRDLRLFGIASSLRTLAGSGGSPLAAALGRLADAGRDSIERGAAAAATTTFVALVADAADALRAAATGDLAELATRLDATSARFDALEEEREPGAARGPAPPEPIPAWQPGPAPEAGAAEPEGDLARAFAELARLSAASAAGGAAPSELDVLLAGVAMPAGAAEEPAVVPIEALAAEGDEEAVVGVETLLYRGASALKHALALQPEIEARLRAGGAPAAEALLREVFDLVQLGLGAGR